jgi:glycosyltransferase involved in cell wall biosynthesis
MEPLIGPLVTVIVPAYNAAGTIGETLDSVLAQTYANLEILVIDDGSTDATVPIVQTFARRDQRIVLMRKANGGVASARNHGLVASSGDFVAPVDADDIWHPTKLEKQMAVMLNGGPELGLVYTLYRAIDKNGDVLWSSPPRFFTGWVLSQLLFVNFVGNASSLLFRKTAALEAGGYEPRLRSAGAEGCEDVLLQLRIASRYQFGCVPEYLVGYRLRSGSMSAQPVRMIRSYQRALDIATAEYPYLPKFAFRWSIAYYETVLAPTLIRSGDLMRGLLFLLRATMRDPVLISHRLLFSAYGFGLLKAVVRAFAPRCLLRKYRKKVRPPFRGTKPAERIPSNRETLINRRLDRLERIDRELTDRRYRIRSAEIATANNNGLGKFRRGDDFGLP